MSFYVKAILKCIGISNIKNLIQYQKVVNNFFFAKSAIDLFIVHQLTKIALKVIPTFFGCLGVDSPILIELK